ncbi:MAG: hypothetical protein V3T23_09835 [Nitrososphaerales archaeon]
MLELHTDRRGRSSLYWNKYKIWEAYVATSTLEDLFNALRVTISITKDELDEDAIVD